VRKKKKNLLAGKEQSSSVTFTAGWELLVLSMQLHHFAKDEHL